MTRWADALEERTGGRVTYTLYPNGQLGNWEDQLYRLQDGVSDVCLIAPSSYVDIFPIMTGMCNLPFLMKLSPAMLGDLLNSLYCDGILREEIEAANIKHLWFKPQEPMNYMFTDKKVTHLEDLAGMKMLTIPGIFIDALEALGATPVSMPDQDWYMALERGVVDGAVCSLTHSVARKHWEVADYILYENFAGATFIMAMNMDTWNSFPDDIKAIIAELNEAAYWDHQSSCVAEMIGFRDTLEEEGMEFYSLSPEERERWSSTTQAVRDKWVEDMESRGVPAREALEIALALKARYEKF
jgi:TRAP-type C4-dicarboxylate transport system substrate-binding protein